MVPLSIAGLSFILIFQDEIRGRLFPSGKRAKWVQEYLETYQADASVIRPSGNTCSKILLTARRLLAGNIIYDPAYEKLGFPNGDVSADRGVCADVLVRSLRGIKVDLQKEIFDDRNNAPGVYPRIWNTNVIDPSIDHRRVPNLMTYFDRNHHALPLSSDPSDYYPCDIVAWDLGKGVTHIGIVTDSRSKAGVPLILHHISGTPTENEVLFRWRIIGHYSMREL